MDTKMQLMIPDIIHSRIHMRSNKTLDRRVVTIICNIQVRMRSKRLVSLGMRHHFNSIHTHSNKPFIKTPVAIARSKTTHPCKARLAVIFPVLQDNTHPHHLAIERLAGLWMTKANIRQMISWDIILKVLMVYE